MHAEGSTQATIAKAMRMPKTTVQGVIERLHETRTRAETAQRPPLPEPPPVERETAAPPARARQDHVGGRSRAKAPFRAMFEGGC